jgi:hypothetical protein
MSQGIPYRADVGPGSTNSTDFITITGEPISGGTQLTLTFPSPTLPQDAVIIVRILDLLVQSSKSLKDTYAYFQLVNSYGIAVAESTIQLGTVSGNAHRMQARYDAFTFSAFALQTSRGFPSSPFSGQWKVSDPKITLTMTEANIFAFIYNRPS